MIIYKRNGTTSTFDNNKIIVSLVKAGLDIESARLLTQKITPQIKNGMHIESVQDIVEENLLEWGYHKIARAYITYREKHRLARENTKTYIDVSDSINDYITQSDWRVNANANQNYSLGGLILNSSGKMIANYWLSHVYPSNIGNAHREGDIHIHDLDFYSGYCAGWSLKMLLQEGLGGVNNRVTAVPPRHMSSAIGQVVNFFGTLQNEWAGAQAFSSFDTYMAPFVRKDSLPYHEVKQHMQSLVYNLNVPSRWGCVPLDTEILTGTGWKTVTTLSVTDSIFGFTRDGYCINDTLSLINIYPFNGNMVHICNNDTDQLLTPNHRVVVYDKHRNTYVTVEARKLLSIKSLQLPLLDENNNVFHTTITQVDVDLVPFKGLVWCPTTGSSYWIARNGDSIFITGNSQSPFTNLTFDLVCPNDLKDQIPIIAGEEMPFRYGDLQKEMDMINKSFIEIMIKGDSTGRILTFPIPTYNITNDFQWDTENATLLFEMTAKYGNPYFSNFVSSDMKPSDIRSMCCRLRIDVRELLKRGNGLFGSSEQTGSVGVVTINMARLGYIHNCSFNNLIDNLDKLLVLAKDSLEIKRKVIQQAMDNNLFPYTKRYLGTLRNHFSTIGINGVNEMIRNFTNDEYDITSDTGNDIAIRILDHIRDKMIQFQDETGHMYNLEATPAEGCSHRFAREDQKRYPKIIQAGPFDAPYYTNSTQLPVGYTDDLFEALELQNELQCKYTGGTVFHAYIGERMTNGKGCKKLVQKILNNYKIPYLSISPTFSICPIHGYIAGEHQYCPVCDDILLSKHRST